MAHAKIEEYRKSLIENQRQKKKKQEDVGTRVLATGADILDNLGTGLARGLEGVVDAGATLVGHIGSIFGADDQWASNFVSKDIVGDFKEDNMQKWNDFLDNSYVNELPEVWQNVIGGATESIGYMLPAIGVGLLTGGTGTMVTMAVEGLGSGTQEGLSQGKSFDTATNYGFLEAGKEALTEYLGGKLFGSSIAGVFGSKTGQTGVKGIVKSMAKESFGEGAEEAIGSLFEPVIQKITINKEGNLGEMYSDALKQMPIDFITGALSGALMNGGVAVNNVAQYGVDGTNAQGVVTETHELVQEMLNEEKKGTLTEEKYAEYKAEILELSKQYETHMSRLISKHGADSNKAQRLRGATSYMNDISTASNQDLAIREAVDKYNKANKTNINYKSLSKDDFATELKKIKGDQFSASDVQATNALIDGEGNILVNKDSQAYKEGKLYNTIGHEFIHTIEKTEGYKTLYNNFVKGLTNEQRQAKLKEYAEERGYGYDNGEQYLLEEAFADYIGENIAVNYKEFSKMLGTNTKLSKIKERLLGYKGVLSEEHRNIQGKVKETLKGKNNQLEMAKASKNNDWFDDYDERRVFEEEVRKRKNEPKRYDAVGKAIIYTANNVFIVSPESNYAILKKYNSDEFYDMTHEGEETYEGSTQRVNGTTEESVKERTSKSSVRSDSTSKEGTANDRLSKGENKNNRRDKSKDARFSKNRIDSQGNTLSEEQAEFFEESQVRDENGNVKVMYHGTKTDFTVFDYSKDGINTGVTVGHWFTDRESWAENISIRGRGKGQPKVMEVYLNITNPVTKGEREINRNSLVRACTLAGFDFDSYMKEYGTETFYSSSEQNYLTENQELDDYEFLMQLFEDTDNKYSQEIIEELKYQDYDGIHYPNKKDTQWDEGDCWVAFDSNQIKDINNKKPTYNSDIRFSRNKKDTSKPTISEDYDTSKSFKFETENETFSIKGINWYEKAVEKLEELESKYDEGEISENSYYNRIDKINEKIEDEISNFEYALQDFESYDLENLDDYEYVPTKKQIERILNYAYQVEDFVNNNFGDLSVDFSEYFDEESAIMQMYKELSNPSKKENVEEVQQEDEEIDYEDEFRRLQEESRGELTKSSGERIYAKNNEGLQRRLSEVFRRRLDSRGYNSSSDRLLHLDNYDIYENVDSELFHDIFEITKTYTENGELVDLHENYDDCVCYLSEDGMSGFAIAPTGDLISVFNCGTKRGFLKAIAPIVKEKATTLDCYVSSQQDLQAMYSRIFGFQTASIMDYNMEYDHDNIAQNHGMPQVAFMVNSKEVIETKHFNKDQYDEAVEYQQQVLKEYPIANSNSQVVAQQQEQAEPLEQVEGEVIGTEIATVDNKQSNKKKSNSNKLSKNDSTTAYKVWADLKEKKKWNKVDVDRFFKALEQDFQQFFGTNVKIDYKGNKENFAKQLFQELNTQSQTSIKESAKNLVDNLTSITIDGMTFEEFLHLLGDNAYQDFLYEMNTEFERLLSKGKTSQMEKVLNYYTNKVNKLAEALRLERNYNVELRKTVSQMKKTIEDHLGKNPTYNDNAIPELNKLVASLNDTLTRTDYLKHDFRDKMENVLKAFKNNEYLKGSEYITDELLAEMQQIVDNKDIYGNKRITIDEMKTIRKVCQAINKIYAEYDQAFINGKKVVASEHATSIKNELRTKDTFNSKGIFDKLKALFKFNMRTQLAWMSNKTYEKSTLKDIMQELEKASNKKNQIYFDLTERFTKAMNSKTLNKLQKSNFTFGGRSYTDAEVMTLYMTYLRGDVATRHLFGAGAVVLNKNGVESKAYQFSQTELEEVRKYMESNYSNLLEIVKEIFHTKAGRYFNETLSVRTGYTNELEKNYFPMHSSKMDMSSSVDTTSQLIAQYQEYLRPSFTKKLEKQANNALIIKPITEVVLDFSYVMSNYSAITPTIQQMNHIFNAKVDGETTLMNYIKKNVDPNFDKDFSQLLINMQGRRTKGQGTFDKALGKVRGNVASASLGANPKVWTLQMASFPLAIAELGTTSSIKSAMTGRADYEFMINNSPYFKERFENDGVRHAIVNTSNAPLSKATNAVGKVSEITSKPINFFAKKLDGMVFNMSIAKIAKDKGITIKQVKADEALMKEALQLAEQVVRRTQSQHDVLEAGSQLYEASEIEKGLYMFTSDLRVIANNLAIKIHDAIVDPSTKGKLGTFVAGIISTQVLVSMLNVVARSLLGKIKDEDEDESTLDEAYTEFLTGSLENCTINMIPIVKDAYNKIIKGYDINNMSLDAINDAMEATANIEKVMDGSPLDASKASYKLSKAFGTLMGIPVKNISEWFTATISHFNPEWAINSQNVLYSISTSDTKKDLALSYKQNRTARVLGNMTTILSDAYLSTPNTQSSLEIARLYSKGYTQVFPSTSIDSISYDSQIYKLNKAQQQQFAKVYNEATPEIEDFISNPKFKTLSDDSKAYYIKKIYSLYYGIAKSSLIPSYSLSPSEEALYHIDASSLMYILASVDKLKASPTLSKKQQVLNYINRQPISKKAKEAILAIYNYN